MGLTLALIRYLQNFPCKDYPILDALKKCIFLYSNLDIN